MAKVLIVDDDEETAIMVSASLRSQGFVTDRAADGALAMAYLAGASYDLILLDWELPDSSGPEICRKIRLSKDAHVPILFLTGRSTLVDKEEGFGSGADDYLPKPFQMKELLLRVNALLRRPPLIKSRQLTVRDIVLDSASGTVTRNGRTIELLAKEFALLEFFFSHPNEIFSADALLKKVWSTDKESSPETVRVTLMRVRQKLDPTGKETLISTHRNLGYRLES